MKLGRCSALRAVVATVVLVAVAVPPPRPAAAAGAQPVGPAAGADGRSGPGGSGRLTSAPVAGAAFGWPLDGFPTVVRQFDPPPRPWLPGHRGVDLAAAPGARVRAAGAGTIVFAGRIAGRGVVSVAHDGDLRTTYEPVDVPASLRAGQPVAAGDRLGVLAAGHPGCPTGGCLHWGLRRGGQYLDPLALLGLARVRLLPLRRAEGGEQRGQPLGQPVVLLRPVVDLGGEPQPPPATPRGDGHLGRQFLGDVLT